MKLVLLPGLDGTGLLFEPLLKTLPESLDITTISYPHDVLMGYEELVEYVDARLPKEDYVLVAESFAGPIAYQLMQRNSSYLQTVIFVATFLSNPRPLLSKLSALFSPRLIRVLPDFMIKSFLLGSFADKEVVKLFKKSLGKVSPVVLSYRLKELSKLSGNHNQVSSKVKTIYIQASNDNLVLKKSVNDFSRVFSEIEIIEVTGSHFVLQTNPYDCSNIIKGQMKILET